MLAFRITRKLTAALLALGLLPAALIGVVALDRATYALSRQAFGHLENVRAAKKAALDRLVAGWQADLATTLNIAELAGPESGEAYRSALVRVIDPSLAPHGYKAFYLADGRGRLLLSTVRAASGADVPDPRLEALLRRVRERKDFTFGDMALATDFTPTAMIARPLIRNGEIAMTAVLEIPAAVIEERMTPVAGLGESGEAYLVGDDLLMRSTSRLDPVHHSVVGALTNPGAARVDTAAAREALAGRSGTRLGTDYRGQSVLSAYTPITIGGAGWALIVELDEAEAFAAIADLRNILLAVALLALVGVGVVGVLASRALARPIIALTRAMNLLAAGETKVDVPAGNRRDEIGEMARAVLVFRENAVEIERLQASEGLGPVYFDSVLQYLSRTLRIDGALIGIVDEGRRITTVSTRRSGFRAGATTVPVKGSVCEAALRNGHAAVLSAAAKAFPDDRLVRDWGAEGCIVLALPDSKGNPFAVMALMSAIPLAGKDAALNLLRLFAARVAGELERKKYEDDLLRSLQELREAKARVDMAVRDAEMANEAKTRFLAAASHDLRQPLQALNLLLAAMKNTGDERRRQSLADQVDVALSAMGNILGSLLDISKIDAGLVVPEIETVAIVDVLTEVAREFQPLIEEKSLDLRVVPCRAVVRSDRKLLANILRNLLSNAVRYTQEGGKILLGCRRRQGALGIIVGDTGRGIPEAELPLIFQEFYQIDNPSRDRTLGLGLGLSIVKKLAALLDHGIEVRSLAGRGSTFTVVAPTAGEVAPPVAQPCRTAG